MTAKTNQRGDLYQRVTDRIVEQLEAGVRPWLQPWNSEHAASRIVRPLRSKGEPFRGVNVLMLSAGADVFSIFANATSERVKDLICRSARNRRKLQWFGEAETGSAGTQPVEE